MTINQLENNEHTRKSILLARKTRRARRNLKADLIQRKKYLKNDNVILDEIVKLNFVDHITSLQMQYNSSQLTIM